MPKAPNLLNDDGSASMTTMVMMSHHGMRRDLARFAAALTRLSDGKAQVETLRDEWKNFRDTLHGHHEAEDGGMFPGLANAHPSIAPVIARLSADHRRIDPVLERGDHAFASLPNAAEAIRVVNELRELLDAHLGLEEAEVLPLLRGAKQFPAPPDDAAAAMYAGGFAWAMHGIAPEVLKSVCEMLPASLVSKLPDARAAFDARWQRVWGQVHAGASRTSVPE